MCESDSPLDEQSLISEYDPQIRSFIPAMKQLGSQYLKMLGVPDPDHGPIPCYRSPLKLLSIPSWESFGVTPVEWKIRGLDKLFGDWDIEGGEKLPDLIGFGFSCTLESGRYQFWAFDNGERPAMT